jgi:hypothetical protein
MKTMKTQPYNFRSHRDKNQAFSEYKPRGATTWLSWFREYKDIRKKMNILYQNTVKNIKKKKISVIRMKIFHVLPAIYNCNIL